MGTLVGMVPILEIQLRGRNLRGGRQHKWNNEVHSLYKIIGKHHFFNLVKQDVCWSPKLYGHFYVKIAYSLIVEDKDESHSIGTWLGKKK